MLGKRSRPMQKIPSNSSSEMTPDHNSDSSSSSSCEKSSQAEGRTSFFDTPKIFIGFNPKSASDSEGAKSPTSPLDVKTFSGVGITHWQEIQLRSPREVLQCSSPRPWERRDSEGVGLGIVAALSNNEITATAGGAVHGSKLKILTGSSNQQGMFLAQQNYISSFSLSSPRPASLKLPYTLQSCSSSNAQPSPPIKISEPRKVTAANNDDDSSSYKFAEEASSPEGMEHSESYTCVITHGPESSIKHIYTGDDCTETVHFFVHSKEEKEILKSSEEEFKGCRNAFQYSMPDFLISCYLCKKPLNPNEDTYMYGGDKGFCSVECRYQQILIDEKSSSFHDSSPAETSAFPASYRSCAGHILSTGKRSPAA